AVPIVLAERQWKSKHVAICKTALGEEHFCMRVKQREFEKQRSPRLGFAVEVPLQIGVRLPNLVEVPLIQTLLEVPVKSRDVYFEKLCHRNIFRLQPII